jgi:hypothetical protein
MLKPTSSELNKREIMKYVGGHGATIKMAAWELDQLGYVKAHSGVANNSAQLEKLRSQLQLANSLAAIEWSDTPTANKKKKTKSFAERIAMAPMAVVVNSNGISCRLGLVCTRLLCICSSSTYCIFQGLLTRKSEIRNIFVGELRANSSEENPPKRTQHILNIVSHDCLVGHMTK